jgi:hypothetical protein
MKQLYIVCLVLILALVVILIIKNKNIESFDLRELPQRIPYSQAFNFKGSGICYDINLDSECRKGYYRTVDQRTGSDECCAKATNYGTFYPSSYITVLPQ